MSSFAQLVLYHEDLQELFFQHQKTLLDRKIDEARQLLWNYREALTRHIRDEEDLLMPVYEHKARIHPGGDAKHFRGDHRNLLKSLEEYEGMLEKLEPQGPDWHRQLIHLLDEESRHKRILEHHDQREQSLFFPALDQATTEEERRDLLARCRSRIAQH